MKTLSGKIYWVKFDFNFIGVHNPKTDETSFISAKITNCVVDENMIKFTTVAPDVDYTTYNINLLINDTGKKYEGKFKETENEDNEGKITCELFQSTKEYFLYGKWTEYDYDIETEVVYTWWARIDK